MSREVFTPPREWTRSLDVTSIRRTVSGGLQATLTPVSVSVMLGGAVDVSGRCHIRILSGADPEGVGGQKR